MYMKKTNLYVLGRMRLMEIGKILDQKQADLKKAPEGRVRVASNKGNIQFYLREDPKDKCGRYVRKNQVGKLKRYIQKSYDEKVIKLLKQEQRTLIRFLGSAEKYENENAYSVLYANMPSEVKKLITPIDITDEEYVEIWQNKPYSPLPISEEEKTRKSKKGEYVRSKSELTIANALFDQHIPYKYECPLNLKGGITVHPDFTVLNVRERKEYYWEHRGMMDDVEYAKNAVFKQKSYMKSGILLGKELVITEETMNKILSTEEIETVIKTYFL